MSQDAGRPKKRGYPPRFNKGRKPPLSIGEVNKALTDKVEDEHPTITIFREYANELDEKHDRYERLVKISRDITIESKRIIFLLHSIDKDSKHSTILSEAESRLNVLLEIPFKKIAQELDGEDAYHYIRSYRAGLQEFIEAYTLYWYLQNKSLHDWRKLAESMSYKEENEKVLQALSPLTEYVLGIADLTGELMRKCISNLATGDIASCFETCEFVRCMYKGFLSVAGISGREVGRKLYTLRQSLAKMENVCYTIKVRGSEIPEHMLVEAARAAAEHVNVEEDEGYQAE